MMLGTNCGGRRRRRRRSRMQVQHLIERCMTFGMSMEECMEALAKRADVQPVVTSTGPFSRRIAI